MPTLTRVTALVLAAALASTANAASPFDGTWKTDTSSAKLPDKPSEYLLQNGTYSCKTCTPAWSVAADGKFHAVKNQPYFDEASVTVVDANNVTYSARRQGKEVSTGSEMISADRKTLTSKSKYLGAANGVAVEESNTATRVGAAPAGAHAVSGQWRRTGIEASDTGKTQTFRVEGDTVYLTTPVGESYTAKFGGPAVPIKGDPGGTMVQLKKIDDRTIEESGSRAGKPVYVMRMAVAPDGKTLAITSTNKQRDTTTQMTAYKQ